MFWMIRSIRLLTYADACAWLTPRKRPISERPTALFTDCRLSIVDAKQVFANDATAPIAFVRGPGGGFIFASCKSC